MAVQVVDLLAFEFVLVGVELIKTEDDVRRFIATADEIVVNPIAPVNRNTTEGRILTIDRDRIDIRLTPGRSSVRQKYPSEERIDSFVKTISAAIHSTQTPKDGLQACGYNVEMVYAQRSAKPSISYIGERLFDKPSVIDGWHTIGGTGAIRYRGSDGLVRNVHLEPRYKDEATNRVFLNFNLHIEGPTMPEPTDIDGRLHQAVDEAKMYMTRLDGVK